MNIKKLLLTSFLGLGLVAVANSNDIKAADEKTGHVHVSYITVSGTSLSGTATGSSDVEIPAAGVTDLFNVPVGTSYDTTDHRPTTITDAKGKVWYLVEVEYESGAVYVANGVKDGSALEKGTVKEGTTIVTYVYSSEKITSSNIIKWDPTADKKPTNEDKAAKPAVKKQRLRVPAGNNGAKTRVPVNHAKKVETKKLRVPAGNNGAKTRVPVKHTKPTVNKPQVEQPTQEKPTVQQSVEENIPANEL